VERRADITVAVVQVPIARASEFGVMTLDGSGRVVQFEEKPAHPKPMPGRSDVALASMGIYIFGMDFLAARLKEDAADAGYTHDFGRDIIPRAIGKYAVYGYRFQDVATQAQAYWRDVGTVEAFYETNLELVYVSPELNLYDADWPIWTYQQQVPSAKVVLDEDGRRGAAINSMVAGGCIISGATVKESILSYSVTVEERTALESSGKAVQELCQQVDRILMKE
ncbi:MAG: sugar phosphate nucleotidyltransferase, partial [Nitrospirales bacterium]|nr:sugar phosphate nucleotidyltransferase [Nitrospirales bacterium]